MKKYLGFLMILCFLIFIPQVKAYTLDDLVKQINVLSEQINSLKTQLSSQVVSVTKMTCPNNSKVGDVNRDGKINPTDALLINKISSGMISTTKDICCMDVNGNQQVDSDDAVLVNNYYIGLSRIELAGKTCTKELNQKNFTMALIFVANDLNDPVFISQEQKYFDQFSYIKNRFPWAFNFATGGLATISIPDKAFFMDGKSLGITSGNFSIYTITKKFLETHADNYDFISIFTNLPKTPDFYHSSIKNNVSGIGQNIFNSNSSKIYGNSEKLIGVNYFGNMMDLNWYMTDCYKEQYSNFTTLSSATNCGMGLLLHELAHQWGVFVGDIVPNFVLNPSGLNLPLRRDGAHYYGGLNSPQGTSDLLAAGTFKKLSDNSYIDIQQAQGFDYLLIKYHPITLYLMGLLPESEYDTKFDVLQENNSKVTLYKQISVRDIIAKYGNRYVIK